MKRNQSMFSPLPKSAYGGEEGVKPLSKKELAEQRAQRTLDFLKANPLEDYAEAKLRYHGPSGVRISGRYNPDKPDVLDKLNFIIPEGGIHQPSERVDTGDLDTHDIFKVKDSSGRMQYFVNDKQFTNDYSHSYYTGRGPKKQKVIQWGTPKQEDGGETKQFLVNKAQENSVSLNKTGMMNRRLLKAQQGMEQGNPQEQVQQLIMAFAEMSQQDPQQIMQELQGMEQAQQQEAIQQMAQAVQQGQGAPQQGQPQMNYGGKVGGVMIDGNALDFKDIKRNLVKKYRKGGETDAEQMDSSSTEAYVTGLKNALQNKMFAGYAVNRINDRFNKGNTPNFQSIPKAVLGGEPSELDLKHNNMTLDQYKMLDDGDKKEILGSAGRSGYTGMDGDTNLTNTNNVVITNDKDEKKVADGPAVGTRQEWNGKEWVTVENDKVVSGDPSKGQATKQEHYYKGWNANGNPNQNRWGMSNGNPGFLNALSNVFSKRAVGIQGSMSPEYFDRISQYGVPEITAKNNIFGQKVKIKFNPITGQQEPVNDGTVDEDGNIQTSISQTDNIYDKQEGINADLYPNGKPSSSTGGVDQNYIDWLNKVNPAPGTPNVNIQRNATDADRPTRRSARKFPKVAGYEDNKKYSESLDREDELRAQAIKNKGEGNWTENDILDEMDRIEQVLNASGDQVQMKYGGGVNLPKASLGRNEEYQDVAKFKPIYERTIDYGAGADLLFEAGSKFNSFLEAMNSSMSPEEEREMQSVDRKFNTLPTDSAIEGLYDRNSGRQLPQDTGADMLAGTNSRQGMYDQKGQKFTKDFYGRGSGLQYVEDGGLVIAKAGMEVGQELDLSPEQVKMMENLGYKIKKLY